MKVTVNEEPKAETETPAANGTASLMLKDGRQVTVRRMGTMDRMRMTRIIGAENSKNDIYLSMAMPAYCTVAIDGQPEPRPQSIAAIEALAERLGDAALLQITLALAENFPEDDLNAIADDFKKRQEIKNS